MRSEPFSEGADASQAGRVEPIPARMVELRRVRVFADALERQTACRREERVALLVRQAAIRREFRDGSHGGK
jgi:hypothetical protein